MDLRTAITQGSTLLEQGGIAVPRLTAEVLLAHAIGKERTYFYAHPEEELTELGWIHYGRYLHQRLKRMPTQYITKKQEFYGRSFRVSPEVLIPRPETELLVETVLRLRPEARALVDVGTGSGAIAVTLALELALEHVRAVYACDLSAGALGMARGNAERLGALVRFAQGDLLGWCSDAALDCVVSNPPYVASADAPGMQREVRDFEPHLALFAGMSGLSIYERLVPEAWRVLQPGGLLAMEIGFGQSEAVMALTKDWHGVEAFADLAGIPRVIVCEKP